MQISHYIHHAARSYRQPIAVLPTKYCFIVAIWTILQFNIIIRAGILNGPYMECILFAGQETNADVFATSN